MKRFLLTLAACLLSVPLFAADAKQYPRGLVKSTPEKRVKVAKAPRLRDAAAPENYVTICPSYDIAGNDQYGICVSAEEVNHWRAWSVASGYPMVVIPTNTVIAWARKYGFLNGAMLPDVMDELKVNGMSDAKGVVYKLKDYFAVDYTSQDAVKAGIYQYKTLNIAIDADCLNNFSGENGWMELKAVRGRSLNHCVGLHGYGSLSWLCSQFKVAVPSGADGSQLCVVLYTWGSVGIVSWPALQAMMPDSEAYGREPGAVPSVPFPTPNPPTPPTPNWPPLTGSLFDRSGVIDGTLTLTLPTGTFRYLIQRNAAGQYSPAPQVFGADVLSPVQAPAVEIPKAAPKAAVQSCPSGQCNQPTFYRYWRN